MRLWIVGLAAFLTFPAFAVAGPPEALSYGGVSIDFAFWQPVPPEFTYSDLTVPEERREELGGEGISYLDTLYRVDVRLGGRGAEEKAIQSRLFLTQQGVQESGNLDFWVDAYDERATIEQAYTMFPDGRRVEVDPTTIQMVADSEDDIFTDAFNVVVPFPALEPGVIAVLVVRTFRDAERSVLPWSRIYYPQGRMPLEEFDFRLTWEEDGAQALWQSDYDRLACKLEGRHAVRCRAFGLTPYATDPDVRYYDVVPSLVVGVKTTWEDLARQERRLVESSFSDDVRLQAFLDDLLQGADSDERRLDRIHRFVSQEIRYIGLEHGTGGVVPRPTALTLERRFGDCKDKTSLFIDLARRAGFRAYPVLTSTKRFEPDKLMIPAASYFNHMVACAAVAAGEEYCVDLTDPYSSYETSFYSLSGAIRLDLAARTRRPDRFPVSRFGRQKAVKTVTRLMPDGSLDEVQTSTYSGVLAAGMRAMLQRKSQEEREVWALDAYERYYASTERRFEFGGIHNVGEPLVVQSAARYAQGFEPGNLEVYEEEDSWLARESSLAQSENQAYDYVFSGVNFRGESVFHLPPGTEVAYTGPKVNLETAYGALRREYLSLRDTVRVNTELTMPNAVIPLAQIEQFNRFMDHVYHNRRIWFAVRPTTD